MLLVVSLLGAPSFAIGHRVGVGQASKSSGRSGDSEESSE
jgi:hypothetical protein